MSSMSGSPTSTGWKRRSSAASFSMCLRYSSSVVAPTARSSPRASIGFSRLAASTAPSAAPAPTIVCSSSRKRTIWPSASCTSFSTAFSRSSNSPRYLEPASSEPMSSAITRRSRRLSGTSPSTIRCASPSTIAVLPTPGSPISTGLFLVRRERTWITRRISSSRPITGSSLPLRASAVRSRPNFSSACAVDSGLGEVTFCGRTSAIAASSASRSAGTRPSRRPRSAPAAGGRSRCTRRRAGPSRVSAVRSAAARAEDIRGSSPSPPSFGSAATASLARAAIVAVSAPTRCRIGTTSPSGWSSSATSRCGGADLRVAVAARQLLRRRDRFLRFDRESIRLHQSFASLLPSSSSTLRFSFATCSSSASTVSTPTRFRPCGGHFLDPAQPLDVALGVEAGVLRRALRRDQPALLVDPQRLRVHLRQFGGDRDHEHALLLVEGRLDAARR